MSHIHYIFGKEPFLIQRKFDALKAQYLEPATRDFNYLHFDGKKAVVEEWQNFCLTPPMMAEMRLLTVDQADHLSASVWAWLVSYLDDPMPTTAIVMKAESFDRRTSWAKKLLAHARIHEVKPLYERDVPPFIAHEAKALNLSVHTESMRLIMDACGADLQLIVSTLEKIQIFLGGQNRTVMASDVEAVLGHLNSHSVFDLVRALAEKKIARSLQLLKFLLDRQESPLKITALLQRHFRLLAYCHALAGKSRDVIAIELGVPVFFVQEYINQARLYQAQHFPWIHRRLLKLDQLLKSSPVKGGAVMTSWLVDFCKGCG